jgi:hypothetical protein
MVPRQLRVVILIRSKTGNAADSTVNSSEAKFLSDAKRDRFPYSDSGSSRIRFIADFVARSVWRLFVSRSVKVL